MDTSLSSQTMEGANSHLWLPKQWDNTPYSYEPAEDLKLLFRKYKLVTNK